jgi:antitoxin MazE
MKTRLKKWGHSLAVRIPKAIAEEAGLHDDSPVDISAAGGNLVVKLVRERRLTLDQLLSRVTDENIHSEDDSGAPVGREVW